MIDTATSNGVAMKLFPIVQAPISIDVDETTLRIHHINQSLCVTSSNNVAIVTGTHKTIFISPRGESLHKEELLVS